MPAAPAAAQPPATVLMDADVVELRRRNLPIPVAGVLATSLVPTFHEARGGGSREHEALDILAPRGTPAVAVEESRVEKLFTSERGGLTVYLFDPSKPSASTLEPAPIRDPQPRCPLPAEPPGLTLRQ